MGIKILNIEEVNIYDSLNNSYEIKEKKNIEYTDFDGKTQVNIETDSETQDFNRIQSVQIGRVDTNKYNGCLCWKSWIIIYTIYHINQNNQRIGVFEIRVGQSKRDEDLSEVIKKKEEQRLDLI